MRRWPTPLRALVDLQTPVPFPWGWQDEPGQRQQRPEDQGDLIKPWCVSGGAACFRPFPFPETVTAPPLDGVQLLCFVYIPVGHTGFVKSIKVAPFKPSVFHSTDFAEVPGNASTASPIDFVGDGDRGYWQTPFGWECYFPDGGEGQPGTPATWRWHLRFIPGDLEQVRSGSNIPPFSFADPNSWFLVPNIPVPRRAYPFGIPGSIPGFPWPAQRFQRVGNWEEGEVHVTIPGDTTVCLFAEWVQPLIFPRWLRVETDTIQQSDFAALPLGPSFGQLIGYSQVASRPPAQLAARSGWQS